MARRSSKPGAATHSDGTPPASTFSHLASGAPPRKVAISSNRRRVWPTSWVSSVGPARSRVTRLLSWVVVIGLLGVGCPRKSAGPILARATGDPLMSAPAALSLLDEVKLQAEVIVPVLRALRAEIGKSA